MRIRVMLLFVLLSLGMTLPGSAQTSPVELLAVDGFTDGCDPANNLAGFRLRYNTGPTDVTIRAQAWTDFLDETTVVFPTPGGGTEVAFTINTPPDVTLPQDTVVQFTIGGTDLSDPVYVAVNCSTGAYFLERLLDDDGRLFAGDDLPIVVFPKLDHDGDPFLEFWQSDDGVTGRRVRVVSAATLADLPETPEAPIRVTTTPGGLATLYKLPSGEFQVNYLPNEEGKVYVVIFDALSPTSVRRADYPQ